MDENRQWFKSRVGISLKETNRDISFCAHAILQNGLFVISDATKDPRFRDNPSVTGPPKIRFYARSAVETADGFALGTLCVVDKKPGSCARSKTRLRVLARHVETQLENRASRQRTGRSSSRTTSNAPNLLARRRRSSDCGRLVRQKAAGGAV